MTEDGGCEQAKTSCDELLDEEWCVKEGAAGSEGDPLECFWLKGKETAQDGSSSCVLKVFLF
jgi:hypothetical protein